MKQTITIKATFTSHAYKPTLSKVYNVNNQKLVAIVKMGHDGPPTDCEHKVEFSRTVEPNCDQRLPVLIWVIDPIQQQPQGPTNFFGMFVQGIVASEAQVTSLQGANIASLDILPVADAKLFANRAEAEPGNRIAATIAKFNKGFS